jgi:hypothetical protein
MKVSFDFDGTLSREDVQEYAKELLSKGIDVWVCTSRAKNPKIKHGGIILEPNKDLYEVTDSLGISRDKIIFTEGKLKVDNLEFREQQFLFHIDDDSVEVDVMSLYEHSCKTIAVNAYTDYQSRCNEILYIDELFNK